MTGLTTKPKVETLLRELGEGATSPGRIFLVGGATAVLEGWRETTLDVDLKLDPEPGGVFALIESVKRKLGINIELASPDQFVPALPGWASRSPFIVRHGCVDFHHYDPYGQTLAMIVICGM